MSGAFLILPIVPSSSSDELVGNCANSPQPSRSRLRTDVTGPELILQPQTRAWSDRLDRLAMGRHP
jgi:hypothetical protein